MLEGLDLGADDCMVVPIDVFELMARMRALIRRPGKYKSFVIDLGRLVINQNDKLVELDGREIHITKIEFAILEALALRSGHLVLNETLMQHTTDYDSLKVHIYRLRTKLGKDFISTIWGRGHTINRLEKL